MDTSVIGGCLDEEFRDLSQRLIKAVQAGRIIAVISELTQVELLQAPAEVRRIAEEFPEGSTENVELSPDAMQLAICYIKDGVVTQGQLIDAQHIAIATVERVDVLLSWNFRHIVNLRHIRLFNAVNLKMGYPLLEIRSPLEVDYGDFS